MKIEEQLKLHKKNITPERVRLFLYMEGKHLFTANDIEGAFPDLGRASIYRSLKLFVEIGALRRVSLGEKSESYEVNNTKHHHEHMKCTSCGDVTSFDSDFVCKLLNQVAKNAGFQMQEHSINMFGICKNCIS